MEHQEKLIWMAAWAAKAGVRLELEGECGFGRPCVGIIRDGTYPDYEWYNQETWEREDDNGDVWTPEDAYHKHECVAVLGRGEKAESQLYEWLKWFDNHGFKVETGRVEGSNFDALDVLFNKHRYTRMVRAA